MLRIFSFEEFLKNFPESFCKMKKGLSTTLKIIKMIMPTLIIHLQI